MKNRLVRALGCAIALLSASACAMTEARRYEAREALARRIADDAIAYNDAYSGAINGQILLNILRAYNRQPRQYMSMTGFENSAPDTRQITLGLSGLPLGELGQEWGVGSLGSESTSQVEPKYTVSPFDAARFADIVYRPTSSEVFRYYWQTWNRDMILMLMVDRMTVRRAGAAPVTFHNSAATIVNNCPTEIVFQPQDGCTFVRNVTLLVQAIADRQPEPPVAGEICPPVAVYGNRSPPPRPRPSRRAMPQADNDEAGCHLTIVVDNVSYTLAVRSLDDMIYYLGELLRYEGSHDNLPDRLETRLRVRAPGSPSEPEAVRAAPLFQIRRADRVTERNFAATASYAGGRFSAGAPEAFFCDRRNPNRRQDDVCHDPNPDRSGSVLELLVGVLARNQSAAAVQAPATQTVNVGR